MHELVPLMRSRFTMGAHDACAKLRCSWSWWRENVRPTLRYAFVTSRALWRISAENLVDMSHTDQCWYDPNELKEMAERHVRIERRSKLVPLEALVADERAYRRRLVDEGLTNRNIYFLRRAPHGDARKRQGNVLAASLTADGLTLIEVAKSYG